MSGFTATRRFLATQQSIQSAQARCQSQTSTSVQVRVEDDTTQDTETGHTTEKIAYLAIQGNGTLLVEAMDGVVTKHYFLGGQRVAMRVGTTTT